MAGSKRMSADEKRKVILDIYHASKSVYTEKDIVTLASKAGVNANTIVEINQSLIDDGLVDKEKIGGSNYFWSFPAKKDAMMQVKHQETLKRIETLKLQIEESNARLIDAKRGREEDDDDNADADGKDAIEGDNAVENSNENADNTKPTNLKKGKGGRAFKLQRLNEISVEHKALEAELERLKENDPQALADLEKELKLVTEAANRWTDNIFNCKSYLTKKRGMDRKEACKILGITDAFDYPEDKIPK